MGPRTFGQEFRRLEASATDGEAPLGGPCPPLQEGKPGSPRFPVAEQKEITLCPNFRPEVRTNRLPSPSTVV